jgi:7-cyano-7-deazaguanine synthase
MKKAIILVSGGMDSCVTVACAIKDGFTPSFLHMNYGQITEKKELQAFHNISAHYSIDEKLIFDISHLNQIGGSCLTDKSIDTPIANLSNQSIPISYVPFRNANILSAAVSWAEVINSNAIYIGAVEEDSSGYPDCRRSFFDCFEEVIKEGAKPETKIQIITPLINLTKKEIIELGLTLNAPLHLTWSCYKNNDKPCLNCDSCVLRERGFNQAKVKDPIL